MMKTRLKIIYRTEGSSQFCGHLWLMDLGLAKSKVEKVHWVASIFARANFIEEKIL